MAKGKGLRMKDHPKVKKIVGVQLSGSSIRSFLSIGVISNMCCSYLFTPNSTPGVEKSPIIDPKYQLTFSKCC